MILFMSELGFLFPLLTGDSWNPVELRAIAYGPVPATSHDDLAVQLEGLREAVVRHDVKVGPRNKLTELSLEKRLAEALKHAQANHGPNARWSLERLSQQALRESRDAVPTALAKALALYSHDLTGYAEDAANQLHQSLDRIDLDESVEPPSQQRVPRRDKQSLILFREILSLREASSYSGKTSTQERAILEKIVELNLEYAFYKAKGIPRSGGIDVHDLNHEISVSILEASDLYMKALRARGVSADIGATDQPFPRFSKYLTASLASNLSEPHELDSHAELDSETSQSILGIPDESYGRVTEQIAAKQIVADILEPMDLRSSDVLLSYFGEGKTYKQIGKVYGIGTERTRQITKKGLEAARKRLFRQRVEPRPTDLLKERLARRQAARMHEVGAEPPRASKESAKHTARSSQRSRRAPASPDTTNGAPESSLPPLNYSESAPAEQKLNASNDPLPSNSPPVPELNHHSTQEPDPAPPADNPRSSNQEERRAPSVYRRLNPKEPAPPKNPQNSTESTDASPDTKKPASDNAPKIYRATHSDLGSNGVTKLLPDEPPAETETSRTQTGKPKASSVKPSAPPPTEGVDAQPSQAPSEHPKKRGRWKKCLAMTAAAATTVAGALAGAILIASNDPVADTPTNPKTKPTSATTSTAAIAQIPVGPPRATIFPAEATGPGRVAVASWRTSQDSVTIFICATNTGPGQLDVTVFNQRSGLPKDTLLKIPYEGQTECRTKPVVASGKPGELMVGLEKSARTDAVNAELAQLEDADLGGLKMIKSDCPPGITNPLSDLSNPALQFALSKENNSARHNRLVC